MAALILLSDQDQLFGRCSRFSIPTIENNQFQKEKPWISLDEFLIRLTFSGYSLDSAMPLFKLKVTWDYVYGPFKNKGFLI